MSDVRLPATAAYEKRMIVDVIPQEWSILDHFVDQFRKPPIDYLTPLANSINKV
jgi:hypothetical protein